MRIENGAKFSRRGALRLLGVALAFGLAGCGGKGGEPGDGSSNSPTTAPGKATGPKTSDAAGKALRVGLVLDTGGVDDKSFNAAAYAGLQRAKTELALDPQSKYVESKDAADYKTNLTQFAAQGYDLVFAVGYKMEDALKEVAAQFPNVKFAIVDGNAPELPNCASIQFKEEQGTFLAGFLAASMSKSKKIGFVGGEEIALIKKFEAGYRAGAKTADPSVQVVTTYTGDWNDLTKGKSQAAQEFGNGVDIIFHAAGKAGLGVIQAAQEKGKGYYAIGVDQDQDGVAPGRVLTSMVKKLDNAVYDTVKQTQGGQFASGSRVFDLKQNGVGLSEMKYTKQDVPADVLARLDKITKMVAAGTVVPPAKVEEVGAFQPPKL